MKIQFYIFVTTIAFVHSAFAQNTQTIDREQLDRDLNTYFPKDGVARSGVENEQNEQNTKPKFKLKQIRHEQVMRQQPAIEAPTPSDH